MWVACSKGDVVEVYWGKKWRKWTKFDATLLAVDPSRGARPVHVQFRANGGNAWVAASRVVGHTGGAVACGGTPGRLDATVAATRGLAARAKLIYKTSQHNKSNEAVASGAANRGGGVKQREGRTSRTCGRLRARTTPGLSQDNLRLVLCPKKETTDHSRTVLSLS